MVTSEAESWRPVIACRGWVLCLLTATACGDEGDARARDTEEPCAGASCNDEPPACDAAHFGVDCAGVVSCVNGRCDAGTCSGPTGDGECDACWFGWTGPRCDLCDSTRFGASCSSLVICVHGTCAEGSCSGVTGNGECDSCEAGWAGAHCNVCDARHYGAGCASEVTCAHGACSAGTCSGLGGDGRCDVCAAGWSGENCDACEPGLFGAACDLPVTCVNGACGEGSCSGVSGDGSCDACAAGWAGADCDVCASGWGGSDCSGCDASHFGPSCEGVVSCVNGSCGVGTCSGVGGDGLCDECAAGWQGLECDLALVESFNGYTTSANAGTQCATGLLVFHSGAVPGWTKAGTNALYAVQVGVGDVAVSLMDTSVLTLTVGLEANLSNRTYEVAFEAGPAAGAGCGQTTGSSGALRFELLRADNSVLASHVHSTPAWAGAQTLAPARFTYVGDGSGVVRLRVSDNANDNRFAGALDDVSVRLLP